MKIRSSLFTVVGVGMALGCAAATGIFNSDRVTRPARIDRQAAGASATGGDVVHLGLW